MCDLKQYLVKVIFLVAVFMPLLGQASGDVLSDFSIDQDSQQTSASLITEAELYEQLASPLTGDFIPVNEFFLWGSDGIAISITDVAGELEGLSNLFQDLMPESFSDFEEYFF